MAKTKTTTLKLDQLIRMKKDLEDSIRKDEQLLRKNNSRPKDEDTQIDFKKTKDKYELRLDQLLEIKEAIRNGNSQLNKNNTTNDKDIYLLSNLNRKRVFLNSLNTFEGERKTLRSGDKLIQFKVNISFKDVEKELKKIEKEIREIEDRLTDFNHTTEVKVELFEELELI